MKTKTKTTKAGLPKGASRKKAVRASHKSLTAFELETITVSLELAEAHFAKSAKSPMTAVRDMHLAFGTCAKQLLDLIRDGQFSFDFAATMEGAK